jgi:hypothetical protein
VTNCVAQRSTLGNAAATMPSKFLNGRIVAAALVWRIFFYRRLTERDLITVQVSDGAKKRGLAASQVRFVGSKGMLSEWLSENAD